MTRTAFEELLDNMYPTNAVMRKAGIVLPNRLNQIARELFVNPSLGTEGEREAVRVQLCHLDNPGHFIFEPEDKS